MPVHDLQAGIAGIAPVVNPVKDKIMILLFCLQRPDIFSFDDLAIQRGLRMVYHYRKIDRKLFEKYRRRFSPYCSVASLYFWAAAGGAVGHNEISVIVPCHRVVWINGSLTGYAGEIAKKVKLLIAARYCLHFA